MTAAVDDMPVRSTAASAYELEHLPATRTGHGAIASTSTPWLRNATIPVHEGGGVSVFTAAKEQLGLTLKPITTEIDVLAIERLERPRFD